MKIVLGLVLFLILLAIALLSLPFLIDLNKYQDRYRPLIEDALNRNITLDDVRLTMLPRLGVRIGGFTVLEDPAFGTGPFASLASLDIGIKLMPLLSGRVDVDEITLKQPVITVVKNQHGVMNVSTLGKQGPASPSAQKEAPLPAPEGPLRVLGMLAVDHLAVTGGTLTYTDRAQAKAGEYRLDDVNLRVESVRLGELPQVHLAATLEPYHLPLTVDGTMGPLVETLDFKTIDLQLAAGRARAAVNGSAVGGHATLLVTSPLINTADLPVALPLTKPVQIKDLRIEAEADYPLKPHTPPLEAATVKSAALTVVLGRSVIDVTGALVGGEATVKAAAPAVYSADLPVNLPLQKSVEVTDLKLIAHLKGQRATLETLTLALFGGQLSSQGAMTLGSPQPLFDGHVALQGVQLEPVLAAVTDKFRGSGTAVADITLQGQGFSRPALVSDLRGNGSFVVKDGKIDGVNLLEQAVTLLKAVGVKVTTDPATVFSTIDGTFGIKNGVINVDRLLIDSHEFQGTATGTVTFDQALNLKVNLHLSEGLSKQIVSGAPAVRLAMTGDRLTVPLLITGTAQAPSYRLDAKALTGKVEQRVKEQVKEAVDDVLKGKKIDVDKGLKRLFGQ